MTTTIWLIVLPLLAGVWFWHGRLYERRRWTKACDGCNGRFGATDLSAVSGDEWLCPQCMDKLMDVMQRSAKLGTPG